jgi:hypothetical protein
MTKTWSKRAQKEHRRKWVAALRSGEYGQTKNELTNGRNFCCLGVACEISGLGEWVDGEETAWAYKVGSDVNGSVLPELVCKWLGLRTDQGWHSITDSVSLATLNDAGKKFSTIADLIESEPEGLIAK